MALIAIRHSDGAEVESFSLDADAWNAMRREPAGSYRMPGTMVPAVLKRSIRGLQFFAHRPGEGTATGEPMSEQHAMAQIAILRCLRAAGFDAWVERPGASADGEPWQADVLCQAHGRTFVFEVQLAAQTLEDFEARTARYQRSGVTCVWLVAHPRRYQALGKAIWYRAQRTDPASIGPRGFLAHLAALPLELGDLQALSADAMRVVVFPAPVAGLPTRIPLEEFALGFVNGRLRFEEMEWGWHAAVHPPPEAAHAAELQR